MTGRGEAADSALRVGNTEHGEGDGKPLRSPETINGERVIRRVFPPENRLSILVEYNRCSEYGDKGALLRRPGLYSSITTDWRRLHRERTLVVRDGRASAGGREIPARCLIVAAMGCVVALVACDRAPEPQVVYPRLFNVRYHAPGGDPAMVEHNGEQVLVLTPACRAGPCPAVFVGGGVYRLGGWQLEAGAAGATDELFGVAPTGAEARWFLLTDEILAYRRDAGSPWEAAVAQDARADPAIIRRFCAAVSNPDLVDCSAVSADETQLTKRERRVVDAATCDEIRYLVDSWQARSAIGAGSREEQVDEAYAALIDATRIANNCGPLASPTSDR